MSTKATKPNPVLLIASQALPSARELVKVAQKRRWSVVALDETVPGGPREQTPDGDSSLAIGPSLGWRARPRSWSVGPRSTLWKDETAQPAIARVLPMQLQAGDLLTDETGEYEVIGRPYTTNAGKDVHARVKKVDQADVTEIRTWGAHERVASDDLGRVRGRGEIVVARTESPVYIPPKSYADNLLPLYCHLIGRKWAFAGILCVVH